ncbi:adenosylcobinamide-GDP ribazoletransferase [Candidatus Spongiisocius sp.]|uniref:adenosylcobinamide-GDP ribazoletransferase n=1 Tax=Candidatus Spongiisocius sp. TaxID=3101273 RepID=UPI003B59BEC3
MNGLRAAIGFLTILPGAPRTPAAGLSKAPAWFPVVGLILGVVLALVDGLLRLGYLVLQTRSVPSAEDLQFFILGGRQLAFPVEAIIHVAGASDASIWFRQVPFLVEGVLPVALLVVLTRGLHLDGFMDTCDGLVGGHDRVRRLELLKDPHVGAFAVIGVVLLLAVKFSSVAALPAQSRLWTIMLVPCLGRWTILVVMDRFQYVRREGLGTPFVRGGSRRSLLAGSVVAVVATVALTGPAGLLLMAVAGLVAGAIGAWAKRRIGGVTGDIYGAACETGEAAVLVLAVVITVADPAALGSPLLALLDTSG